MSARPPLFPLEIASRIVRLYSFVGDFVVDPFAGLGTPAVAAEPHGRRGIGFEIALDYEAVVRRKAAVLPGS